MFIPLVVLCTTLTEESATNEGAGRERNAATPGVGIGSQRPVRGSPRVAERARKRDKSVEEREVGEKWRGGGEERERER